MYHCRVSFSLVGTISSALPQRCAYKMNACLNDSMSHYILGRLNWPLINAFSHMMRMNLHVVTHDTCSCAPSMHTLLPHPYHILSSRSVSSKITHHDQTTHHPLQRCLQSQASKDLAYITRDDRCHAVRGLDGRYTRRMGRKTRRDSGRPNVILWRCVCAIRGKLGH